MTAIKLLGAVDLEELHDACAGISATVALRAEQGKITLMLAGEDAIGSADLLVDWLRLAGIEVAQPIG